MFVKMDPMPRNLDNLPTYHTIFGQVFSPDGGLLAVGNDKGKIVLFRTKDLVSSGRDVDDDGDGIKASTKPSSFVGFEVGPLIGQGKEGRWSILDLESAPDFLIASTSDSNQSYVFGMRWKDLEKKKVVVAWSISPSSLSQLPVDVNSIVVDEGASTQGRIFMGGGGPPINQPTSKMDNAVKVIDLETKMEVRSPMSGHSNYIHQLSFCKTSGSLVSASEDGTAKLWDPRTKSGLIQTLRPSDHDWLRRPHLGDWIGAASLSGDWVALGGGPRPALWHLRTQSPIQPGLPPHDDHLSSPNLGGVHALRLVDEEQRVIIGGEFGAKLFMANMSDGQMVAEIPTSGGCATYSIAHSMSPFKILSAAGSGSSIDLCTANFCYKDLVLTVE